MKVRGKWAGASLQRMDMQIDSWWRNAIQKCCSTRRGKTRRNPRCQLWYPLDFLVLSATCQENSHHASANQIETDPRSTFARANKSSSSVPSNRNVGKVGAASTQSADELGRQQTIRSICEMYQSEFGRRLRSQSAGASASSSPNLGGAVPPTSSTTVMDILSGAGTSAMGGRAEMMSGLGISGRSHSDYQIAGEASHESGAGGSRPVTPRKGRAYIDR